MDEDKLDLIAAILTAGACGAAGTSPTTILHNYRNLRKELAEGGYEPLAEASEAPARQTYDDDEVPPPRPPRESAYG